MFSHPGVDSLQKGALLRAGLASESNLAAQGLIQLSFDSLSKDGDCTPSWVLSHAHSKGFMLLHPSSFPCCSCRCSEHGVSGCRRGFVLLVLVVPCVLLLALSLGFVASRGCCHSPETPQCSPACMHLRKLIAS